MEAVTIHTLSQGSFFYTLLRGGARTCTSWRLLLLVSSCQLFIFAAGATSSLSVKEWTVSTSENQQIFIFHPFTDFSLTNVWQSSDKVFPLVSGSKSQKRNAETAQIPPKLWWRMFFLSSFSIHKSSRWSPWKKKRACTPNSDTLGG